MKRHYYLQGSFTILIGLFMLSAAAVSSAEEITLTTYYPSPYGVYSEMRLYPKDTPTTCSGTQRGLMYYDDSENRLKVCNGTPPYQDIGGGYWAASPSNSANIYNTNLGNVGIGTTDPLQLRLYLNANVPTPTGRNGMQISTPLGHYVSLGGGIGTDGSNTAGLHIGNQAGLNYGGEGGTLYYDYDAPDRSLVAASTGGIRIAALGQHPPAGRDIIFATNPSNIERMRITDVGNVGIGTTIPA